MLNELICFLVAVFGLCYLYVRKRYSHWDVRTIPFDEPEFPYGSIKGLGSKFYRCDIHRKMYLKYKGKTPIVGFWTFLQPEVLVLDVPLIKNILVKDFTSFVNRGMYSNPKDDPLSSHLVSLEDNQWRNLRNKVTPTFTSGKMKYMFPTIVQVAGEFVKCVDQEINQDTKVEWKDLLARFTTDVIGNVAFGVECNSLKNPNAEFREMGRRIFQVSKYGMLKFLFADAYKGLARKLRVTMTPKDIAKFFMGAVNDTVVYREKNHIKRNDLMDLLIKLKNEGRLDNEQNGKMEITMNEICAEAFVFFAAGFETSSTTLSFALLALSQEQEIQEKGRQEVKQVLEKYNGEFTYEALAEMKYIAQIIDETLRMYPPGVSLSRIVSQDYEIAGTNYVLKKGEKVIIPTYSLHHDPEYYPDPEKFNPDRFLPEEVQKRNQYTYMPFGEGPRACIGLRFGLMQSRIGLATLLNNFKFSTCEDTPIPLKFLPNARVLQISGGLWLDVKRV